MFDFVPTTPTPPPGYLVFAKRSDVILLDMTAEEAAKMVISAGIVAPDFLAGETPAAGPMSVAEAARRARATERVNPPSAA